MDAARFVPGFLPDPSSGDAYWTPYRGDELLVQMTDGKRGCLVRTEEMHTLGMTIVRTQHIGTLDGVPCVAAELAPDAPLLRDFRFFGLRAAYGLLEQAEFDAACMGFQIQHWDRHHRFCAGCGGPLEAKRTERAKHCESCKRDFYPPVVPAIIVRVERGDQILMTRQGRFPKGMYGLVAGFLEPGETLERCVAREVLEETGIAVKNVRYFGSQPWPFPHQVMVGFTAEHAGGEIVVDTNELEEAVWFARDAMPMLPPPLSIARQLIDDWIDGGNLRA